MRLAFNGPPGWQEWPWWSYLVGLAIGCFTIVGGAWSSRASANLPSSKWGEQLEIGTVGNSTVIKVNDDGLICIVLQPKTGGTPAFNCWGAP